jgi:hypothetical protein
VRVEARALAAAQTLHTLKTHAVLDRRGGALRAAVLRVRACPLQRPGGV